MRDAYSYTRFSSAQQATGDSLRRQTKLAAEYAAKNGLNLRLDEFHDAGISAFEGKNADVGALGAFINAVETGRIKRGSTLLVESLDRISRNEVDEALELFLKLIRLGITIVTLTSPAMVYSKETIKADRGMSLIIGITVMVRAHEESATKASRVSESWQEKFKKARESGLIFSAMAPAWLSPSADRKSWIVDKKKAKVVQRIFQMAADGHGSPAIAIALNKSKTPTMQRAKEWTFAIVAAILKNEAVLGTYVPRKTVGEKITNYYPKIVEPALFYSAREATSKRQWKGGRGASDASNLFAGLCYCVCGARMRSVGSSKITRQNGETVHHLYLRCLSAYSSAGTCDQDRVPYRAAERAILQDVAQTLAGNVAKATTPDFVDPSVVLRGELDLANKELEKLIDLSLSLDDPKVLAPRINSARKRVEELTTDLNNAPAAPLPIESEAFLALVDNFLGMGEPLTPDMRKQVQVQVRRIVERVEFECDGGDGYPAIRVTFTPEYGEPPTSYPLGHLMEDIGGAPPKPKAKRASR